MPNAWRLKLINKPEISVQIAVRKAWAEALGDLKGWAATDLVEAMTFGGLGIGGISSTPFYRFISSPEGLSQLGIDKSQPPLLLRAYERSAFKVSHNNSMLLLQFGDVAALKIATPHPGKSQGLQVQSWMEMVLDDFTATAGFVPRKSLPRSMRKKIRLSSPLGGLMLPMGQFGSTGSWQFPDQFRDYDVQWLQANAQKIETAIVNQMIVFLRKRLK
jgi:hypothetical protein